MLDSSDLCVAWVVWSLLSPLSEHLQHLSANSSNGLLGIQNPVFQDSEKQQHFLLQAHPLNNFLIVPINVPECTRFRSEIWLRANGLHTLQAAFAKHRHTGQTGKVISPSAGSSYLATMYSSSSFTAKNKYRFICLAKQYLRFNPFFTHSRNFLIWTYCCLLHST